MPEPVIARVPVRGTPKLECLGRIEPAVQAGSGAAALTKGGVPQLLDTLDIVLATTLQALFTAIKR